MRNVYLADELCDTYTLELTRGIGQTGIKAGVIKVATGLGRISECEMASLRYRPGQVRCGGHHAGGGEGEGKELEFHQYLSQYPAGCKGGRHHLQTDRHNTDL